MVWVRWFSAMPCGPEPIGWSRAAALHPAVVSALQRDPFSTDTAALSKSATYTKPVPGSTVTANGDRPVGTTGKCPLQPAVSVPLQVAPLMTDAVPGMSPFALLI